MDPATIAAAIVPIVAPVVIKCGGMILKRFLPGIAADVTEEGFAAVGRKAGGCGIMGRIGECVGRVFGWGAGLVVEDQARPVLFGAVDGLMAKAGEKFLDVAGEVAMVAVKKKMEATSEVAEPDDVDQKIKTQMLANLQQKNKHNDIKEDILKVKLEMQQLKLAQKRMEVEAADEKRRQERQEWKIATEKPAVVLPEEAFVVPGEAPAVAA
jgi:hypothetical protein